MVRGRRYIMIILCLVLFCIFGWNIQQSSTTSLSRYVIDRLGIGRIQICSAGIIELITSMLPLIFIEIIEGISIYKHYTMGSVYYFIRQKDLKHWYKNESKELFLDIFKICFGYLMLGYIIGALIIGQGFDWQSLCMLLCQCTLFVMYIFIFAMLMNMLSIFLGTEISYVISMGIQLIFVMMILVMENMKGITGDELLFRFNPITCITLTWHYIPGFVKKTTMDVRVDYDVMVSVIYLGVLGYIVYRIGKVCIIKADIAMENKEEQ